MNVLGGRRGAGRKEVIRRGGLRWEVGVQSEIIMPDSVHGWRRVVSCCGGEIRGSEAKGQVTGKGIWGCLNFQAGLQDGRRVVLRTESLSIARMPSILLLSILDSTVY